MDLTPSTRKEMAAVLREASAAGRVVDIRGAGLHARRGRPFTADEVISTRGLTRLVDHVPDDMTITVEAGITMADLADRLQAKRQRLPLDVAHADR
ncbi:MAG: FAD-binding protein, partial [Miltoncostaeaceae bacterium]